MTASTRGQRKKVSQGGEGKWQRDRQTDRQTENRTEIETERKGKGSLSEQMSRSIESTMEVSLTPECSLAAIPLE